MELMRRFWPGGREFVPDPEKAMFARLFRRLLFWYCTLLAVLSVLLTLSLGTIVPWLEVASIQHDLAGKATQLAQAWRANPNSPCAPSWSSQKYMLACYDARGKVLRSLNVNGPVEQHFLNNVLVLRARREPASIGDVWDESGTVQVQFDVIFLSTARPGIVREAVAVHDPARQQLLGVVQLGTTVAQTLAWRDEIVNIYLTCMLLVIILGSPIGGWYLARKALTPTRLAFQRQQDFIANVSHELGTPLALLRANADVLLLNRARLVAEDRELLEDIVAETTYMDKLLDHMLLLARMDAGRLQLQREKLDLAELAENVVRRARAAAEQAGITLVVQREEATFAWGDRILLEQVTLILLDNATKYTRAGGTVKVCTFMERERACLRVSDTGIGIASAELARLGERFYRVDKARSRESGGSGLGLSIAYAVLAQHGGELTLTSQAGQGTTATVYLPTAPA